MPLPYAALRVMALVAITLLPLSTLATHLEVTQVEAVHSNIDAHPHGIAFTVEWDDSWYNDRNHDAAWVFFKRYDAGRYEPMYLADDGTEMLWKVDQSLPDAALEVAGNGAGLLIYPSGRHRGSVTYRIFVALDADKVDLDEAMSFASEDALRGYGLEMVYIPKGAFTLGDPDPRALQEGAFYRSDAEGEPAGLYRISASDQVIEVAPREGALYYRAEQPRYQGDQRGPVPASFPNGYAPFYLMKYEIRQGDYAAFLNSIGSTAQANRANFGSTAYTRLGGTIALREGVYTASAPGRRNVFMHWDDMMAFLDWAGLRPYTEFEYTKACRGPLAPTPLEYPWNTNSADSMLRRIDPRTHARQDPPGLTEGDLNEDNRDLFGASYYWVMDLAGSMWEKVITVGDATGRSFEGTHGDGRIDYLGYADVDDWPAGSRDSAGYGYRGGGYYGKPDVYRRNPFDRIAFRNYGAWSGGPRNAAYGTRGAHTSPVTGQPARTGDGD